MSGRNVTYNRTGLGRVGQSWEEDFNPSYGFDPFGENAFAGDVPDVNASGGNPATATNWYDGLISSAEKLGTAWLSYDQAKSIQELNLELVRQGKEPISQAEIAPQVRVGIAPDTQRMILYAALGLGALVLFGMLGKRR